MSSSARKRLFLRHHWRCFFFKPGEKHTLFKTCEDGSKVNSNISESPLHQGQIEAEERSSKLSWSVGDVIIFHLIVTIHTYD